MLNHHTVERLNQMRLTGMAHALLEQMDNPEYQAYSFEERMGFLVDKEYTFRQERRLTRLLRQAKLKIAASLEDIDYRQQRGLDRAFIRSLATCEWIESNLNVLITGSTGVGKTFLACALGNAACRHGISTQYYRIPSLLSTLTAAKGDGSYLKLMRQLGKTQLLILDDWGIRKFKDYEANDILEIIEDRSDSSSTIITSQLPLSDWHEFLPDPTLADAIMDRLVHRAYKFEIKGDSMRKVYAKKK